MKKGLSIFVVLFALTAVSCGTIAKLTPDEQLAVENNVANKDFKIDVNRAHPMSGRSVNLTSPYSLTIKGDSVYSYLPYFGRAYSVPYGGGVGLHFNGVMTNYNVTSGKRNMKTVSFDIRSPEDQLTYTVDIWPEGNSAIQVTSQNRQTIRFNGNINLQLK